LIIQIRKFFGPAVRFGWFVNPVWVTTENKISVAVSWVTVPPELIEMVQLVIGKGMDNLQGCRVGVSRVGARIADCAPLGNPHPDGGL
jgi:hypothetical protein